MKKLILIVTLVSVINVFTNAQQVQQKTPQQRAANMAKVLEKKLNLTPDQATKVNTIMLIQSTRLDSLKSNPQVDKKSNRLSRRSILEQTDNNLNDILNTDQKKSYANWKELRKEKQLAKKGSTGTDS